MGELMEMYKFVLDISNPLRLARMKAAERAGRKNNKNQGGIMARVRAMKGKAIVRRQERGRYTVGGIFVPDVAQEKSLFCEVEAVGRHSGEWGFKKGDTVVVFETSGKFNFEGVEYLVVTPDQVLGVVE